MKDNFSTTPYMSSNLREYNRIYKEVNDIYRDAASKFGLSNSVFESSISVNTLLKETIFPIVEVENEAFTELSFEECNLLLKLHSKYTTALREKFSKL